MNDAEAKVLKARLDALWRKWRTNLGLNQWRVVFAYERSAINGYEDAAAVCSAQWQYRHATVVWNLLLIAELDPDHLEWVFLHEMAHILLNESEEEGVLHHERAATDIASVIQWTYEAGVKAGRKASG